MASLIPIATYNLNLQPFSPAAAVDLDFPTTIRITSAALDPEPVDKDAKPSTLRLLKRKIPFDDDYDEDDDMEEDELDEDEEDEEEDEGEEQEEEEEEEEEKKEKNEDDEEEEEEEEDSDLDDEYDDEEFVICTLSPETKYQQTIDITIQPDEEVYFVVTGSYPIHLSGNYVDHPDDEDSEDEDDEEDYDSDEYDLTPDEDELYDLEDLEDASDVENKIEELVEEENNKKRSQEEEEPEEPKETKKSKKAKKEKVQFSDELEHGPGPEYGKKEKEAKKDTQADTKKDSKKETKKDSKKEAKKEAKKETKETKETTKEEPKDKKYPTKTLLGGVVTEDRKLGKGTTAKSGNRVGIRYIGKLKNGKVFDKNTSGKPFTFGLGKGECIKGFDLGVTGMAVGGERRVVIPPKMGYGSQALPGIPANSELTFDIKLVSLK